MGVIPLATGSMSNATINHILSIIKHILLFWRNSLTYQWGGVVDGATSPRVSIPGARAENRS
jgi:hypothetical protein